MALGLARWQFGVTTVFHFFFVPVTTGLSVMVAWLQTLAYRRRDADWERLTRFFGRRTAKLASGFTLASVVVTVVTGDIQARLMDTQQPMKMAAAEALYNTARGASLSVLTIGNLQGQLDPQVIDRVWKPGPQRVSRPGERSWSAH